jgi:hypothetical protein
LTKSGESGSDKRESDGKLAFQYEYLLDETFAKQRHLKYEVLEMTACKEAKNHFQRTSVIG